MKTIVGILAAVALPSYSKFQIRSNRAAAESWMLDLANREQQYLLDKRTYLCGGSAAVDTLRGSTPIPDKVAQNYDVTIPTGATCPASPPGFQINAAPKAGTIQAGDGTLTLNELGVKQPLNKW